MASQQKPNNRSIAVIGGGISGLAAAHRLLELCPQAKVVLLEASERVGGVIRSERRDGFLVEHSADNFITTPPWAVQLCERLGFEGELIKTNTTHRRALVVRNGALHPIPTGFTIMAPSRIWPIVSTPILSLRGKLRMACEMFVRQRVADTGESLAAFVRRRFGKEVYERLVQPLVAGIFTGDADRLSVGATMPRFLQMEKDHGSLIRAIWKQRKSTESSSGARYSQFVAPREGMSSLVQKIADRIGPERILLESPLEKMTPTQSGGWKLAVGGPRRQEIYADGIIMTSSAAQCSKLLQNVDPLLADNLAKIEYGSSAIISLGFNRQQIGHPLDGFGFVVPFIEKRKIFSASFTSVKYKGRAPEGQVLLRAFVGGAYQSELVELDDDQLQKMVLQELNDLLAIRGEPIMWHVTRQIRAMPQYNVGHEELVQQITQRAAKLPNLGLTGNALGGIGIPACIQAGEQAAESMLENLSACSRC